MGIINTILGNASEMNEQELQRTFGPLLCEGEVIVKAYRLIRDKWVFTNKRIIL
mgnify:FL=1